MEYTELSAYDPSPGVVTTWTPSAEPDRWRPDERSLSPNHEIHLSAQQQGEWIGSVLTIPAPLEPATLVRALRAWLARHEALRTSVETRDGRWRRRTLPADAVTIESADLGPHTAEQAREAIGEFLATVGPTTWPHCVFATVAEEGAAEFTLAFGADHSVMDAYSQLLWFDEIASLYERAAAGASDEELAVLEVGSHVDHAHAERVHADGLGPDADPVARWREFLSDDGRVGFPAFPVPGVAAVQVPRQRAELRQASFATWLADARRTHVLNQLCRAGGTSLQAGVLAAMASSFRQVHGLERVRFVLPMHTRFSPEHAAAVGWYVGLCPVDLDLTGLTDLSQIVAHVHERVSAGKELVPHPFARVGELLEVEDTPHFAVSYVDGRFVPGADRWAQWRARALRSPAYADDEVYLWFGRTADGLNVSARYPETITAERAMRDLVAGIGSIVDDVTAPYLDGAGLEPTA